MKTRTIIEGFATEISELEIWKGVSQEVARSIHDLWQRSPVLVVRRQALSNRELTDFSRHFGPLEIVVKTALQTTGPSEIAYITNLKAADGEPLGGLSYGEVAWHTDQAYRLHPATGAVLYGGVVPEQAGRTFFNNLYLAWEHLPDELKSLVEGREGVYSYHQRMYVGMKEAFARDKPFTAELMKKTPDVVHPLVLTHPVTGRKSLYFDASTLTGIVGMSAEEGQRVIDRVAPHVTHDDFMYTHVWETGDVLMWDNGCLLHRREPFEPGLTRLMTRTTIQLPESRHCKPTGRLADTMATA